MNVVRPLLLPVALVAPAAELLVRALEPHGRTVATWSLVQEPWQVPAQADMPAIVAWRILRTATELGLRVHVRAFSGVVSGEIASANVADGGQLVLVDVQGNMLAACSSSRADAVRWGRLVLSIWASYEGVLGCAARQRSSSVKGSLHRRGSD